MMFYPIASVLVSQAAAASGSPFEGLIGMAPLLLMFVVFYFLLIRPANKQRKDHAALLTSLQKDDEVVTSAGFYGKILALDENVVTLEIADKVKIRILKDRIAGRWNDSSSKK